MPPGRRRYEKTKAGPTLKNEGWGTRKSKEKQIPRSWPKADSLGMDFLTDESERRKANPSVFVMRQKRRDDSVDREKLILLVTFRGRGPLASDNPIRPRLIRSGWTFLTGESSSRKADHSLIRPRRIRSGWTFLTGES